MSRTSWLVTGALVGAALIVVAVIANVTALGIIGAFIMLLCGALVRAVWSNQAVQQAPAGTQRIETVWRGADGVTIERFKKSGWTLIDRQDITGLGGKIGARLTFRKD